MASASDPGVPSGEPWSDNLIPMHEITATDAARRLADILDAVEHRGEHFTIVRRGRAIAHLGPSVHGRGSAVKDLLRRHAPDPEWRDDLESVRSLLEVEARR